MTTKETVMTTKRKTGISWRLSWRAGALAAWGALAAAHAAAAVDGTWASSSAGGSWNDAANWVGGVLPDGGAATFNLPDQKQALTFTGTGDVALTNFTFNGALAHSRNTVSSFSGLRFSFSAPAHLAANASSIEFKDADALVCPDLLTVTGTGRVHFTGSRNQLGRVRIADGGWLRIARDTSIGPTPDVLDPAAITLDGGILQNGGETTVAATRGLTLSERGGALAAGYDGNAHLTILSPITGPGGLDIAFETRPVVLSNPANDWAGDTRVGTAQCEHWGGARFALALGADDVLPHGPGKGRLVLAPLATATNAAAAAATATAPIDLAGHVATVNAVDASCKGVVKSSAPGGALKTCGDADSDFRGTLASGATLEKHGAGTLALSAASASVSGELAVHDGAAELAPDCFAAEGRLTLAGGTTTFVPMRGARALKTASPQAAPTLGPRELYPALSTTDSSLIASAGGQVVYRLRWRVPEAGVYSFAKSYQGAASLAIDGATVLSDEDPKALAVVQGVSLSAGWHDVTLRFTRLSDEGLGANSTFKSGLVYDPLNGAFQTEAERSRACVFTHDGGPDLLAVGVPTAFAGELRLQADATLTVAADAEPFVFAGRLTTDAAAPRTLTFQTASGAPFVFGGARADASALLDAPVACAAGLVATNYVWFKSAPPAGIVISPGTTVTRAYAGALAEETTLDATDLRIAAEGLGDGTIVVPAGRRVTFTTQGEADGAFTDGADVTRTYANNVVLQGGTLEFSGAGTITFTGTVSGSGTILRTGAGEVLFPGGAGLPADATVELAGGTFRLAAGATLGAAKIHLHGGRFANTADCALDNPIVAQSGGVEVPEGTTLTLTGAWQGVEPVSLWGAGTLRLAGAGANGQAVHVRGGTLALAKPAAAAHVIGCEPGATLRLEADDALPPSARVSLNGGTCDLNGHNLTLDGLFCHLDTSTVRNDGAADATLTVAPSAPTNLAYSGTLADGAGRLFFALSGAATCDFSGATLVNSGLSVANGGTISLARSNRTTATLLRFNPTAMRPGPAAEPFYGGSGVQISEFRLTCDGEAVSWPEGTTAWTGTASKADETPDCVLDGKTATKWYTAVPAPLVITCPAPVAFNGYQFATAGDAPGRDPASWTVDVGTVVGAVTNWTTFDRQVDATNAVPLARGAFSGVFSSRTPVRLLPDGYRLHVAAPATLALNWIDETLTNLSGDGTLVATNNVLLALADGCTFTGRVAGGDAPIRFAFQTMPAPGVTPATPGTTLVNDGAPGALAFTGTARTVFGAFADGTAPLGLAVSDGATLALHGSGSTHTGATAVGPGAAVLTGQGFMATHFRFTPLKGSGGQKKQNMQLSELQLVRDGARLPWPDGTTATSSGDNSAKGEGASQLLDGSTSTKCYWAFDTAPVVVVTPAPVSFEGYRWFTANDSMDSRNPVSWTFEYSLDGESWTLLDEQTDRETVTTIKTLAYTLDVGDLPRRATDALSDFSTLQLAAAATCSVSHVEETVGALAGAGTLRLSGDARVRLAVAADASFSGEVVGTGDLVKAGAATQTLSGDVALDGTLVVEAGVLLLDGAALRGVTNIVLNGGTLAGAATVANDLVLTSRGGVYAASLDVAGRLALDGVPTLGTGFAGQAVRGTAFTFKETDDAARAAFAAAACAETTPGDWVFARRTDGTSFSWSVLPGGTMLLLR